jgi:starch synthase
MTSLIPMFLKTTYKDDPIFANSKVVYTVSNNYFASKLKKDFTTQLQISDNITKKHVDFFKDGDNTSLNIGGSEFADALLVEDDLNEAMSAYVKKAKNKLVLKVNSNEDASLPLVSDFYKNILAN